MTEYFVLDWDAATVIVGQVVDRNHVSLANKFTRGAPLAPDEQPVGLVVEVETPPEGPYPDYFTLQQTPIVSTRFVTALRSVVDNFEAYPVEIVDPVRTTPGYFVLNVLGRVRCMDRDATVANYVEDTNVIMRVKKLALDPSKARGFSLFRLHEFKLLILVEARVKDALTGMSGVSLLPAEGWGDHVWF